MSALVPDAFFRAAAMRAEKPAVFCGSEARSYGELAAGARLVAQDMTRRGARRVALRQSNSIAFLENFLGVAASGAVVMVMDPAWPADTADAVVARHQPDVIIDDSGVYPGKSKAPALAADAFMIVFTAGSTGAPKAVLRTHRSWIESFAASAVELGTGPGSRVLAPGPLAHSLTLFAAMDTLSAGGTLRVQPRFSAEACARMVEAGVIDTIVAVPTVFDLICAAAGTGAYGAVTRIVTAGAKLSTALRERLKQTFPAAETIEYYGASELSFVTVANSFDVCLPDSVGRAFHGAKVEIREDDASACAVGQIGTVWVNSAMLSEGYIGDSGDHGFRRAGDWATVGDRGFLDQRGFLTLVGRNDDMIITGGSNVFPAEVEGVVERHPAVNACAVIGMADERWGQLVTAVITLNEGRKFDADDLNSHCRLRLPSYKVPRRWSVAAELPRTASGKVDRRMVALIAKNIGTT